MRERWKLETAGAPLTPGLRPCRPGTWCCILFSASCSPPEARRPGGHQSRAELERDFWVSVAPAWPGVWSARPFSPPLVLTGVVPGSPVP